MAKEKEQNNKKGVWKPIDKFGFRMTKGARMAKAKAK